MLQNPQENEHFTGFPSRLVPALVLIVLGGIFLLSNFHLLRMRDIWQYWPVILMVAGVFRLTDATEPAQRIIGGILLVAGGIILAGNLGLIGFPVWNLWPVALIAAGVYLLVERAGGGGILFGDGVQGAVPPTQSGWPRARGDSFHAWRKETAVFSGGKRKIAVADYRGGKYEALFGGFEIDLRGSQIAGDSATLEINAVFGGAEVKIPRNWSVLMRGVGVFGAFADSAEQPNPAVTPNVKQLIVKGAAVFGGVEVKN